jgi:hypothetical protein
MSTYTSDALRTISLEIFEVSEKEEKAEMLK